MTAEKKAKLHEERRLREEEDERLWQLEHAEREKDRLVREADLSRAQLVKDQAALRLQQEQQQKLDKTKQDKLKLLQQQLKAEQLRLAAKNATAPTSSVPSTPKTPSLGATLPTSPQRVLSPSISKQVKRFSQDEMNRFSSMSETELSTAMSDEDFKVFMVQKMLQGANVAPKAVHSSLKATGIVIESKSSGSYVERSTIISKMLLASGIEAIYSQSQDNVKIVETHLVTFLRSILKKLASDSKTKSINLDRLAELLMPDLKLIRIIEYQFALTRFIETQRKRCREEDSENECTSYSSDEDKEIDDIAPDEHAFNVNDAAFWHPACLAGSKDTCLEEIARSRADRRALRDRLTLSMEPEYLNYFHNCCTVRMGESFHQFRQWLEFSLALRQSEVTLTKDVLAAFSFLADYRIYEIASEGLKRMPKSGNISFGDFQDLLRQIVLQFE